MLPLQSRICRSLLTLAGKYHLLANSLAWKQIKAWKSSRRITCSSSDSHRPNPLISLWATPLLVKAGEKKPPACCKCSRSLLHRAEHEDSAVILNYSLTVKCLWCRSLKKPGARKSIRGRPVCGKRNVLEGATYSAIKKYMYVCILCIDMH